ncbi:hypothetical protein [Sulfuricurvum sp.]|uniref:hypothetical protein n=1 Tax=Sulfuricurvum sp. TaxID=2025608 RepID=UPI0035657036
MNDKAEEKKRIVQALLDVNDNAVINALLTIYARQTQDEQQSERTIENNAIGFSGVDAEILSSFARQYNERGFLTFKQMVIARKNIKRYWRQVIEAYNGNLSSITDVPKKRC